MTGLLFLLGIVLFVLLIAFSIGLHEAGHMFWAKRFGVRVPEFMIGFGPRLWSRRRGETEYGVKAVPLGGYVRLIGMYPPGEDGTLRDSTTGRFGQLVADARQQAAVELLPGDEDRVVYKLTPWKKIVIFLGGPVMNLLLAFVLFAILLVGIGQPQSTLEVREVTPCVAAATGQAPAPTTTGGCPAGSSPSPAAAAGVRAGDTLVALGGVPATSWEQFSTLIRSSAPGETTLTVLRDGVEVVLPVTMSTMLRPVLDADGADTGTDAQQPFLGVGPTAVWVGEPLSAVPATVWDTTVRSVEGLLSFPAKIVSLAGTLLTNGERDPNGPVSVVGVSRISGDVVALDEPWQAKAGMLLGLAASVNLFLFLFNLVPLLPLDGGHIAGALYESARRRLARLRGRSDPGPFDTAKLLPVAYAMTVVLIGVGVIVIAADLVKPISLF